MSRTGWVAVVRRNAYEHPLTTPRGQANYLEASSSTTPGGPSPFSAASPFMSTHTSSSATSPRLTSPVGPLAHSFGGTTTGRLSASESPMFAPFVVPESMPPPPMARATRSTGTSPVMPVAGMHGLQVAGRAPHDRLSAQLTDAQLDAIARAASSPQEAYAQGVLAGLTPDLAETFAKAVGGPAGTGDVPGPAPSNLARRMRQDQRYASQTAASTVVSMGEPADAAGDINSNIDWDTFAATGNFYARQQDAAPFDARPAFPLQVASVPERPRMHQHTQSSDLYSYIMSAGLNSAMPASAPADMPIAPPPSKRLKERAPSKRSSTSRSPKAQARISASPGPFSTSATDNGSADERAAGGDAAKDPVKQARRREINRKSAQTMRLKRKEQLKEAELARDEAEHARKEAEARVKQLEDMLQSETRKRMLAEDRLRQVGPRV